MNIRSECPVNFAAEISIGSIDPFSSECLNKELLTFVCLKFQGILVYYRYS